MRRDPAPAHPRLSSDALRIITAVRDEPGAWNAATLAEDRGWGVRMTQQVVRELEADGYLLRRDEAHLRADWLSRAECLPLAYRLLPERADRGRALVMAWVDGHRTVAALAEATWTTTSAVQAAWARLARQRVAWPLCSLVLVESDRHGRRLRRPA